jgi:hypothetical protein
MCPQCHIAYDDFRTGLTYQDVFMTFWRGPDDPEKWHPKRRNSILGRWHEIKLEMWAEHIEYCNGEIEDFEYEMEEY